MSEQRGIYIGQCGHLRPLDASGWIGSCACEYRTPRAPAGGRDYFAQMCTAVEELGRSRHLLSEVIALAGDAPGLTDEQQRDRLVALADRTQRRDPGAT